MKYNKNSQKGKKHTESQLNDLKLTKKQLDAIINNHMHQDNGMNEILEAVVNALMITERKVFLAENQIPNNKANGFRSVIKAGMHRHLKFQIPRDRLGVFKPLVLAIMQEEEEKIKPTFRKSFYFKYQNILINQ